MNSCLHIKSFLGQEKTTKLLRGWSPLSFKENFKQDKEFVEEPMSFICGQKEGTENDPRFGKERSSSFNQLQNTPKTSLKDLRRTRKVPGTIKAKKIGTELTQKGTGFPN
ncbi:hypothetical protein O181_011957 [Austropuccinia psidii MF-1]|uniref:Uncharacterized protein n=1 Tax=Austropuccinia psidii MF-1 TaxID=1389203 RepID=A0A9Q3GMK0_9BASI|nr:hypothetical protein [Austropuccinia psidii MF-1]